MTSRQSHFRYLRKFQETMSAYAELFFKRHFNLTTDHREEMAIFLS
jgi:hypothetical protein